MAKGYYKVVSKLLLEAGFRYSKNAKGSHEKWVQDATGKMVLVPYNLKVRHTANRVLKQAGLDRKI